MSEEGKKAFNKAFGGDQGDWSEYLMGIRKGAEENCANLEWNEDLMPVLFIDGIFPEGMPGIKKEDAGKQGTLVLGLVGDCLKDDATKDQLCQMIFGACVKTRATGIAMLNTVWMSILPAEGVDLDNIPSPSQDPNRIEKLMIISCQHGGEDDGFKTVFADIKREEGKPPVLFDWTIITDMDFEGRFHQAMSAGIDIAARLRAEDAMGEEGEEWKQGA